MRECRLEIDTVEMSQKNVVVDAWSFAMKANRAFSLGLHRGGWCFVYVFALGKQLFYILQISFFFNFLIM